MNKTEFKRCIKVFTNNLTTDNTKKTYSNALNNFLDFLKQEEISTGVLKNYREFLVNARNAGNISTSTANLRITVINKFFRDSGHGDLYIKPLEKVKKFIDSDAITENDYKALIKAAQVMDMKREELIIETLATTGIRVSELKYFTVENVRESDTKPITVINKRNERPIVVIDSTRSHLLDYAENENIQEGVIFHARGDNSKMLDKSQIWRNIQRIADYAGINKHISAHSLRHYYASLYLKAYPDNIGHLADLLGHSSIETTRIYTHLNYEQSKEMITKAFK